MIGGRRRTKRPCRRREQDLAELCSPEGSTESLRDPAAALAALCHRGRQGGEEMILFFCIHMPEAVRNGTEHIPNTKTNDDHCPSEAHCDPSQHSSPASVASFFSLFSVEITPPSRIQSHAASLIVAILTLAELKTAWLATPARNTHPLRPSHHSSLGSSSRSTKDIFRARFPLS